MKKRDMDQRHKAARVGYRYPLDMDQHRSRLVVQQDVKPAQDAYASVTLLCEQLRSQLQRPDLEFKERASLAKQLRDAVASLVTLREEGRATAAAMSNAELLEAVKLLIGGTAEGNDKPVPEE